MLLEADKYSGGPLPDVSQSVVLPQGIASVSGAAGLRSGTDYAAAIRAMAYRPLTPTQPPRARDMSHLDEPIPTPDEQRLEKSRMERRRVAALVRRSAEGTPLPVGGDPTAGPGGPDGSLFPGANQGNQSTTAPNNLLLDPTPPLLPPPNLFKDSDEDDLLKSAY